MIVHIRVTPLLVDHKKACICKFFFKFLCVRKNFFYYGSLWYVIVFYNLTISICTILLDSSLGPVITLRTEWAIFSQVLLLLFIREVYNNRLS